MDNQVDTSVLPADIQDRLKQITENDPGYKANQALMLMAHNITGLTELMKVMGPQFEASLEEHLGVIREDFAALTKAVNGIEKPDNSQVVDEVSKLGKSLAKAIAAIPQPVIPDMQPRINVAPPSVEVQAPSLRPVADSIDQLKTFFLDNLQQVVDSIPETDNKDVIKELKDHFKILQDIAKNSRMRPQFPNTFSVKSADGAILTTSDQVLAVQIDDTAPPLTYIGKALPGTSTAASVWQIRLINETTGTHITFAGGSAGFNNIWDQRTSLTYL